MMTGAGRPLRFMAVTLGGWTALRVAMLWPTVDGIPALVHAVVPPVSAASADWPMPARLWPSPPRVWSVPVPSRAQRTATVAAAFTGGSPATLEAPVALGLLGPVRFGDRLEKPGGMAMDGGGVIPAPLRPTPVAQPPGRLSGSVWLLARGGANGTLSGGRLGASQAGVRLRYALDGSGRLALSARFATPLAGQGQEAGFGVEWQPTRLPVRILAEERVALDGGRGGPTLEVIGGLNPVPIAAGVTLESYGQAGAIARDGIELFADGAARASHALVTIGRTRVDLGLGAWGAAQRHAERLDIGPSLGVSLPVRDHAIRLTVDWRARVAGGAAPGSGPALSIGSDF